jgi:hypothetical protein
MKQFLLSLALFGYGISATAQSNRNGVLAKYYSIKEFLVLGDSKNAMLSANELIQSLDTAQFKNAATLVPKMKKDAKAIASSSDINKQRVAFATLSEAMIEFVKVNQVDTAPIYVDYCPMKKTYWLSAEKTIRNPYYGSAMLTCGSITDTIQ